MEIKGIEIILGDRLYNHGDMANPPKFGEVKGFEEGKWGSFIIVQWEGQDTKSKITTSSISVEYKGNGSTRIVTEAAYNNFREKRIAMYGGNHGR